MVHEKHNEFWICLFYIILCNFIFYIEGGNLYNTHDKYDTNYILAQYGTAAAEKEYAFEVSYIQVINLFFLLTHLTYKKKAN